MPFSDKKDIMNRGQVFLSFSLFIGGIIVAVGILFAFLIVSFIDSGYGLKASEAADVTATAGVEDALLRLARNGAFSNTAGYSVASGGNTTLVTVNQNTPSSGLITVLSVATVSLRTRKINAVLSENPATNQVSLISWQEIQ